MSSIPWHNDWLTVSCNVTLTWWPPLWSSAQSSRLQIQRFGFDSQRYQIFSEVVGMERGPLSLVSTTEELLGRNTGGSVLESREYGLRDLLIWPRDALYPQKVVTNFTYKRRSLGRYNSLADSGHWFVYESWRLSLFVKRMLWTRRWGETGEGLVIPTCSCCCRPLGVFSSAVHLGQAAGVCVCVQTPRRFQGNPQLRPHALDSRCKCSKPNEFP
jgi:hypothetical protein